MEPQTLAVRDVSSLADRVADEATDRLGAFDLVRSVVDPVRLAVLGASVAGPVSIDELSSKLGIERKDVAEAIGYLRGEELLDESGQIDRSVLSSIARSLPEPDGDPADTTPGLWTDEEREVLARFFTGTRLTSIPSSFAQRKLVLEKIVQDFEPGIRYPERDVNFTIQLIHADYAVIRRYLVDVGFLDRSHGMYWRTGGRLVTADRIDGDRVQIRTLLLILHGLFLHGLRRIRRL